MAKVRAARLPPARKQFSATGAWTPVLSPGDSGTTLPAPSQAPDLAMLDGDETFETPMDGHDDWSATVAMREQADEMLAGRQEPMGAFRDPNMLAEPARPPFLGAPSSYAETRPARVVDLAPLPDRFALVIERKGEQWKVTAPEVHPGLWVAHADLFAALAEAPAALAQIVGVDGVVPGLKRRKR